jgi:hypothetical protein
LPKDRYCYRRRLGFGAFGVQSNSAVSLSSSSFDAEQVTGLSVQNPTLVAQVNASNPAAQAVGLMARLQSNGDGYAAVLTTAGQAEIILFHEDSHTYTVLASASAGSNIATMTFSVSGNTLSLICGTANISVNDSTLSSAGAVGVFTFGANGVIDNFSVCGS